MQPEDVLASEPSLASLKDDITILFNMMRDTLAEGGCLYICGNGGSYADSLHIVGELVKSFERERPLDAAQKERLTGLYGADELCANLEQGLAAIALGTNSSLVTALLNDCDDKEILFAQELMALGREGDMLLGISTSGNARDVMLAVSVAMAKGLKTAALTGKDGGMLKGAVDTAVVVAEKTTREVQQVHQVIYHTLCRMLEEHFYG